jgi:hypothetical protein
MRTHVVAVRVLDERQRIISYLVHELDSLSLRRMINAPLEHAAPMTVRRNLDAVSCDRIIDKLHKILNERSHETTSIHTYLIILRSQLIETLLNNMIPVQILDQNHNMQTERDDNRVDLSIVSKISLLAAITNNVHCM